jgi:uncharacterized membrane protein YtjA (UPF0391 family)
MIGIVLATQTRIRLCIKGVCMLRAAVMFFVLALISILFGAYGIAGLSLEIGKTLLTVFIILAVISFVVSLVTGKKQILH